MEKIFDFDKLFELYLKRETKSPKPNEYHPSSLGTNCSRKLFYTQLLTKEFDLPTLKIFCAGDVIHNFFKEFLEWATKNNKGIKLLENEKSFNIPLFDIDCTIVGRVDNIVEIDGEKYVFEIKSTKSVDVLKKPNNNHVTQLNIYELGSNIKKGLVIYVEKNTLQMKYFFIEYSKDLFLEVLAKIQKVSECIKNKVLPERIDSDFNNYECNYCNFSGECRANFNPTIKSENNVQK